MNTRVGARGILDPSEECLRSIMKPILMDGIHSLKLAPLSKSYRDVIVTGGAFKHHNAQAYRLQGGSWRMLPAHLSMIVSAGSNFSGISHHMCYSMVDGTQVDGMDLGIFMFPKVSS